MAKEITKELAIEWLDKQVDAINVLNTSTDFGVEVCGKTEYVNLYSGLFALAKAIGAKVKRERFPSDTHNVKASFNYRGIEFLSLYNVKLPEVDLYSLELEPKCEEELFEEREGIFKDMNKIIKDFDEATSYSHKESGVLGNV